MEAFEALINFYTLKNEHERFNARYNSVEFLTTLRIIDAYLTPGCRILEIGAASGRYSHRYARMGYPVDAVELIPHNIELFKEHTEPGENVTITEGNATDLSFIPDNTYDITLLLGPMYHLFTKAEQEKAMAEAVRVTKHGGILAAAYCMNEATMMNFCFLGGNLRAEMDKGMIDPVTFKCDSDPEHLFELWRSEEIFALTDKFPLRRLKIVGTDMYTNYFREAITAWDEDTFRMYLDYHFSICERADLIGMSHHTLDVLQKEE